MQNRQANLVQLLGKEKRVKGSKRRTFSNVEPWQKYENGVAYKSTIHVFLMKHLATPQRKRFDGTFTK